MMEWFSPEASRWFVLFCLTSLIALTAPWVAQGKHRGLVTGLHIAGFCTGLAFIAATFVARAAEQPIHVVRPLLVVGVVLSVVFGTIFFSVRKSYTESEERRMLARDL